MSSLIGTHNRTNGIKQLPCRAVLSLNGVGLGGDETHPDTITIVRDTRVFPGSGGETTPDFNTFQPSTAVTWGAYGQHWYKNRTENGGNFRDAWALNPADYYQLQNERGGNDPWDIQRMVDIERAISWAAGADGVKCCVLNLAGGTPGDFELWKAICAPFIMEAWETWGHIFGRHCYADWFVEDDGSINNGQPQRVINELEYLKSIGYGGGVVLTECGLYGGYGVSEYPYFEQQVTRWEQALRPYADIFIGLAWWETGASEFNADYTDHIKKLLPYIQAGNLPRWAPSTQQPPDGEEPPMTTIQISNNHGGYLTHLGTGEKTLRLTPGYFEGRTFVPTGEPTAIVLPDDAKALHYVSLSSKEVECPDEPADPNPPPVVFNPLPQGALFADVSANNKIVNLAALKAQGVQGVGIRLSNGIRKNTDTTDANGVDKMAQYYIEEAESIDMPWLGYHFSNEHFDDVEQVRHFLGIANQFIAAGHVPEMGLWIDFETPNPPVQGSPTTEDRIELQLAVLATERPSFIGDYGPYTSIGWWNSKVPNAPVWVPALGLKSWAAAWVPTGTLVNGWPPSWWHPAKLKGFTSTHFWQWTSAGGLLVGHSVASLDLNFVGGTAVVPGAQPPPPPPPTGATYSTSFMKAVPNAWRVIQRFDGSGEDIWDLPLGGSRFVRVKNFNEGEWYNGNMRERDTSPAPQSDGTERLYLLNGGAGGQIAPDAAVVGVMYSFTNYVQFKAKQGCVDLAENSGTAVSTFLLKEVIDNYTFPSTGFTVDRLFWTVQTGENQLYAIKDGVNIGWVGGGAQQDNNVWGGALAELYFDRSIPQQEPPKYC